MLQKNLRDVRRVRFATSHAGCAQRPRRRERVLPSRFRESSSIQEMLPAHLEAWPFTETEAKITVQVARLDSVAPQLNLQPPILAKLDVQGHELSVIRGGRETLSRCQRVMMECNFAPLYEGQPLSWSSMKKCRSSGFCSTASSVSCVIHAPWKCSRLTPSFISFSVAMVRRVLKCNEREETR